MEKDCLFCKILSGEIPAQKVYEDESVFAFKDINPQAPLHVVIIPKKHIPCLSDAGAQDIEVLGAVQLAAAKIAAQSGQAQNGFRVVNNCGKEAGQTVFHIHYHLLAGRQFGWPPG